MASDDLEPGSTIDGFRIEQRVHTGGMATLWRVTRADQTMPMLMKIPKIFEAPSRQRSSRSRWSR